jgi:biotin-dependent carboxylase-like uncharacterized protein
VSITVLESGFLTTVQDLGRPGYAHLGVPRAGSLDRGAADLANRLVGNPLTAAVLETTLTGVRFRAERALTMAITGAEAEVWVGRRRVAFAEAVTVPAHTEVRVGPAGSGVRSYIAPAGGIDVGLVLGSRSTDTLAYVGPPVVTAGTVLPVAPAVGEPVEIPMSRTQRRDTVGEPVQLRLHLGPRHDWFGPDLLPRLAASAYVVTSDSNRVGLRLHGPGLTRSGDHRGELASEGIVLGAVQIPPDGRPLVFLRDHPVTGGYPVVAVVDETDLDRCAQLRPGARIRFLPA